MEEFKIKLAKALEHFDNELKKVRTGRAHSSLLESVSVEAYGSMMPLEQVASISAQDATMLVVTPWDKSLIEAIQKAIISANLGLNPAVDSTLLRVPVPQLTEETRKQFIKNIDLKAEEAKISIRQARKDAMNDIDLQVKEKKFTLDMKDTKEASIQKEVDNANEKVEEMLKEKQSQLMRI